MKKQLIHTTKDFRQPRCNKSVTGTQIFTHTLYPMLPHLGDAKCLKDVIALKKFGRIASSGKVNVLYLLHCCGGTPLSESFPLKDLEEMEQMVPCAIPLKFRVVL